VADPTHPLTIYLIKPGTSIAECLNKNRKSERHDFTLSDGTKCALYTDSIPPHEPRWVRLFTQIVPELGNLRSSNASALLFLYRNDRLFALTFGYGRSLLTPGSWEEDFGLRATLNSVDVKKIRSVDRATLDSIGQHSRIQASREATIGEFGLDLEQDLLQAVTGIPTDVSLGKQLTGKDALNVKLPITLQKLPELLDRYSVQAESKAYKDVFPWLDQIHELKNPAKIAELDASMVERIKAQDFTKGLWLSIPEIIEWAEVDGFKYRDAQSAASYTDVHISTFLEDIGGAEAASLELLKKRRLSMRSHNRRERFTTVGLPIAVCTVKLNKKTKRTCSTMENGIGSGRIFGNGLMSSSLKCRAVSFYYLHTMTSRKQTTTHGSQSSSKGSLSCSTKN
jgi:uncharacterized protein (TIGR04141 family)